VSCVSRLVFSVLLFLFSWQTQGLPRSSPDLKLLHLIRVWCLVGVGCRVALRFLGEHTGSPLHVFTLFLQIPHSEIHIPHSVLTTDHGLPAYVLTFLPSDLLHLCPLVLQVRNGKRQPHPATQANHLLLMGQTPGWIPIPHHLPCKNRCIRPVRPL